MEENKVVFNSIFDNIVRKINKSWVADKVLDLDEIKEFAKGDGEVIQRDYHKSVCIMLVAKDNTEYDMTYDLEKSSEKIVNVGDKISLDDLKLVHLTYQGDDPKITVKECWKYRIVQKPKEVIIDANDPWAILKKLK